MPQGNQLTDSNLNKLSPSLKLLSEMNLKVIMNRIWMNCRNDRLDKVCRLIYQNAKDIEIRLRCATMYDILAGLMFTPRSPLFPSLAITTASTLEDNVPLVAKLKTNTVRY